MEKRHSPESGMEIDGIVMIGDVSEVEIWEAVGSTICVD
jgi:hypothetical protein